MRDDHRARGGWASARVPGVITDALHQRDVERACRWLIERHYATGHGETIEDVLKELEWQAKERGAKEHQLIGRAHHETEELR